MNVESFLPLKPLELLILTMLAGGSRHGYGLRQDIQEHTGGTVTLEAGNLYRHIRALEDAALVREVDPPSPDTDARRIYYDLTPLGRRVLTAELRRLRSLVELAEERGIVTWKRA